MARQRRGGFKPPELKGTLGSLLRTTLQQAGAVKDVLSRGAREGRERLDEALSERKRHDALAELGAIVLELIRRGEIDAAELPEVRDIVASLDEIDAGHIARENEADSAASHARRRFDDRGARDLPADAEDGTVSARTWAPPTKRSKSQTTVWRPKVDAADERSSDEITARQRPKTPSGKKGGISFDDEDLADYMHPDDVPKKPPTEGDA